MDKEHLFSKAQPFLNKIEVSNSLKNYYQQDEENLILKNKGSFFVYNLGSVKKSIAGAVEYDITLEFKDEKCRYTITNYLFNPYKRNRYGKFEPINGKYKALEKEVSKSNMKEWKMHRKEVCEKSQALIINLNNEFRYNEIDKHKTIKKDEDW